MRNYRSVLALLLWLAIADSEADKDSQPRGAESLEGRASVTAVALPPDWKVIDHDQWLSVLSIRRCAAAGKASEGRLRNIITLGADTHLLLLTCELGAYQDAYYVYTVNSARNTVSRLALSRREPEAVSGVSGPVRGRLYISDDSESLELLNLSSATGACGWKARYPIESVKSGGVVRPEKVYADDDCYNGVTVEDWPATPARNLAE